MILPPKPFPWPFGVPCPTRKAMKDEYYASATWVYRITHAHGPPPEGPGAIENRVSAPGVHGKRVHIMAGVPKIMQAMMDAIAPAGRCQNVVVKTIQL
jgi:molybdopterin-biosynthesis enzyme MoeA-like protein